MKKKRVVIIAPTGMLGNAVYKQFHKTYELILLYRSKEYLKLLPEYANHMGIVFDLAKIYQEYKDGFADSKISSTFSEVIEKIGPVDGVINCAGITKPHSLANPELTLFINGAFPHLLSGLYKEKLIQIATDCVFDGNEDSPFTETDVKLPADLYGLSKSLGEPSEKSLVLRTSIIGEELHAHSLFISWVKKQKGDVLGFTNHFWNGMTTNQFAKICDEIISHRKKYPQHGLFHIFSSDVSKYDMVVALKEKYKLDITVIPKNTPKVDRRLRTAHTLNEKLHIPDFATMIQEL